MDLEITGQSIRIIFCDDLVSGSVGEYIANFKFDDSWDGYELIAVFEGFTVYQRESREMNIVNGSCTVPCETLLPNGYLQVGVYGIKGGLRRPTIYTDRQLVRRGTECAKIGTEYTPGAVEQFVTQTAENRKAAEEAATRAENAAIHQPYPNSETGTWWVWDAGTGQYEDTGEITKGDGVPDGGTSGQLLSKTESGIEWIDPPQSGVQSDWNQNDDTQPDYVKNRPFYTGDPVETVLVEESTPEFFEYNGAYASDFPSTFEATVGETYKVFWDGTTYECACVNFDGTPVIGNLSITDLGSDTGEPFLMIVFNGQGIIIHTADTSASHTFSISGLVPEVVKIDEKYLPENIANKSEVEAAQTTANNAQAAADKNKETLSQMLTYVLTFTFDKQTSGRDTFTFNSFKYYKISDFNPAPEDVISFKGTRESGVELSETNAGNNCVKYGFFIVVAAAGVCSLKAGTVTHSFTAPSAGLYARYEEGNTFMTAGTGEFTLMSIDGLTIKSSTYGSTKKFRITVDDSGLVQSVDKDTGSVYGTMAPAVTAKDNGKFLRVRGGQWAAVAITNAEEVSF